MVSRTVFAFILLMMMKSAAARTIWSPSAWARPGACLAVPLHLSAEYDLQSVTVEARPPVTRLWHTVYSAPEDAADLDDACLQALVAAMHDSERADAYVLIKNEGSFPAAAHLKVSLQRVASEQLADLAVSSLAQPATAGPSPFGGMTQMLDQLASAVTQMIEGYSAVASKGSQREAGVGVATPTAELSPGGRVHRRKLAQTPDQQQQVTDQITSEISKRITLTPEQKKYIKIAIIIGIVLAALFAISLLVCIIRCICMPCCCAARLVK